MVLRALNLAPPSTGTLLAPRSAVGTVPLRDMSQAATAVNSNNRPLEKAKANVKTKTRSRNGCPQCKSKRVRFPLMSPLLPPDTELAAGATDNQPGS